MPKQQSSPAVPAASGWYQNFDIRRKGYNLVFNGMEENGAEIAAPSGK